MRRFFARLLCAFGLASRSVAEPLAEADFTEHFVSALRARAPEIQISVTGPLELRVKGEQGESTVYLNNAFVEYSHNPSDEQAVLDRYVASIVELKTSGPIDRANIVPIIKARGWLSGTKNQVVEDFNQDLVIVYAEDSPRNIRYFSAKELEDVGLVAEELRALAVANLRRILPDIQQHRGPLVSMLTAGGDYVASLLLLDDLWTSGTLQVQGDIVVAVPSRDVVLFTGSENAAGVKKLQELAHESAQESSYAITDQIFVFRDHKFERLVR